MLTRLEKAQQKWGGSHSVIDKWLTERQELSMNAPIRARLMSGSALRLVRRFLLAQ